jgi:hypothetical protein
MYTNENLFVYNKIKKKTQKTIGLVAIRFELSELKKKKMDILRLACTTSSRIGLLFLIAMIIKNTFRNHF